MARPAVDDRMSLLEHLEELRSRLIKIVLAFALLSIASWFFYDLFLGFLVRPLERLPESDLLIEKGKLITTAPPEALFIRLKVTAFAGVVLALPVILWQVWRFVTPGLYRHEKRYAVPFVAVSLMLFAAGCALALYTLPKTLDVLVSLAGSDFVLLPRASEYLSFILLLVVAFGLTFEIPLALVFLALAGVISSRSLKRARRYAWVGALALSAVVTPTQDPFTMMVLAVPLGILYEATILTVRLMKR